ncbi:MAG: hypothetical protein AB7O97_18070 [Planctomycetota bacterium]
MRDPVAFPVRLAVALALAAAAPAQFLNRAVWLGADDEGLTRTYDQGPEHYLDRIAYTDLPPWRRDPALEPFDDRLVLTGGSASSSRLTTEGVANLTAPLDDVFLARVHYLQSEHQGAQFERVAFGVDAVTGRSTSLFAQVEGAQDKSRADLSLGVDVRGDGGRHRLGLTLVDFASRKGEAFDYAQDPVGLLAAGHLGEAAGLALGYELAAQLPTVERGALPGDSLRVQRVLGALRARRALSPETALWADLELELTQKAQRATAGEHERADTRFHRLRLEYARELAPATHVAAGVIWVGLDTDVRRGDGATTRDEHRDEWFLSLRAAVPLGDRTALEPYALGGGVHFGRSGLGAGTSFEPDRASGFQGKCGVPFVYRFSERAAIRFDASLQLDRAAFGGGGVQLVARF